jgi:hypothetical protein
MYSVKSAAGAFAAAILLGTVGASAADLDHDRYSRSSDRYSSAYEDKRYRDIYGPAPTYAPPPHYAPPPRYYRTEPVPGYTPPGYVYRGRDDDADTYDHGARRHYVRPYDRYSDTDRCLARDDIRRRLSSEGWRDFRDVELRGDIVRVEARRRGESYVLKVDRCTGDVVGARPVEDTYGRPYAFEPGPDRMRRPYY